MAQVYEVYPSDMEFIIPTCKDLLDSYANFMHPSNRFRATQALSIINKKGHFNCEQFVEFFIKLLSQSDKNLRKFVKK